MIGRDCRCPGCGTCDAASEVERLRGERNEARAHTSTAAFMRVERQRDEARAQVKAWQAEELARRAQRDTARAEVEVLRRERDDLYGAVMLAEERGAEWAIRAKAQVVYSLAGDASYVMLAKEVCEQARGKR